MTKDNIEQGKKTPYQLEQALSDYIMLHTRKCPLTISGFCEWLGIKREYFNNNYKKDADYGGVMFLAYKYLLDPVEKENSDAESINKETNSKKEN